MCVCVCARARVCVCVFVCVCVCAHASEHVFDLGLYLSFRCALSSLSGEAFFILCCFHLLCSLSLTSECPLLNGL